MHEFRLLTLVAVLLSISGCQTLEYRAMRTAHAAPLPRPAATIDVDTGANPVAASSIDGVELSALRTASRGQMKLHFINVGQGAATLVEFPGDCGAVLIDAGSGPGHGDSLARYLESFFENDRADLDYTVQALFLTHPHQDHLAALASIGLPVSNSPEFLFARNIVDDGQYDMDAAKTFSKLQGKLKDSVAGTRHKAVIFDRRPPVGGYANAVIDPVQCSGADPEIRVLWGGSSDEDIWPTRAAFRNPNNHSLVIRIDYGEASVLITGDLMEDGIAQLLAAYAGQPELLDIDIYVPGHHGAANGTNQAFLDAMTPVMAVIQVGDPTDGAGGPSAWGHGHPDLSTLRLLKRFVACGRSGRRYALAMDEQESDIFIEPNNCQVYATGWNGNIVVNAFLDGRTQVEVQCDNLPGDWDDSARVRAFHECVGSD